MVQKLSERMFFQEKVKFLKSGIWFQFYAPSNKDASLHFFDSPGTRQRIPKKTCFHVRTLYTKCKFI